MGQKRQYHSRTCITCRGAGEITVNNTNPHGYGPDPQCDEGVICGECNGRGEVRVLPIDPLEVLAAARRRIYKNFPTGAKVYGRIRQEAVSPVCLP